MTDFTYNVWEDPDNGKYGFAVSFSWRGGTYNMRGYEVSPTRCWETACGFMLLVCNA